MLRSFKIDTQYSKIKRIRTILQKTSKKNDKKESKGSKVSGEPECGPGPCCREARNWWLSLLARGRNCDKIPDSQMNTNHPGKALTFPEAD